MNQKQKISLMIKIGFFVVFFLIIALIVLLVTTLLTPAKDITHSENAVSDSPNTDRVSPYLQTNRPSLSRRINGGHTNMNLQQIFPHMKNT